MSRRAGSAVALVAVLASWGGLPAQEPQEAGGDLTRSARTEVAAALMSMSATLAAAEQASSARIEEQVARIRDLEAELSRADAERALELEAALLEAREAYLEDLAERDRAFALELAVFRGALEGIVATPEGSRALEMFNDGDELGALAILDDLRTARDEARRRRADLESAAEARRIALLALEARSRGKLETDQAIRRFEEVVSLDPGVAGDWRRLANLYLAHGSTGAARDAAARAVETAETDRDRYLGHHLETIVARSQGRAEDALAAFRATLRPLYREVERAPDDLTLQRDLWTIVNEMADTYYDWGDLERALEGYQQAIGVKRKLLQTNPNAGHMRDLAEGMAQVARIHRARGNLPEARRILDVHVQALSTLLQADSTNPATASAYAMGLRHLADVMQLQGDRNGAAPLLQESLVWFRRLHAQDATNAIRQRNLASTLQEAGRLALESGRPEEALTLGQEAVEVWDALAARDPEDTELSLDVALVNELIGMALQRTGRREEAEAPLRHALQLRTAAAARNPINQRWQRGVSQSHNVVGLLLEESGRLEEAREHYLAGLEIARGIVARDSTNAAWKHDLTVSLERIGDLEVRLTGAAEALPYFAEGLSLRRELVQTDSTHMDWLRDLSISQARVGDVYMAEGDLEAADVHYRESLAVRRGLVERTPDRRLWRQDLAYALDRVGDVHRERDETDEAADLHLEALALREGIVEEAPTLPRAYRDTFRSHIKLLRATGDDAWGHRALDTLLKLQELGATDAEDERLIAQFREALGR